MHTDLSPRVCVAVRVCHRCLLFPGDKSPKALVTFMKYFILFGPIVNETVTAFLNGSFYVYRNTTDFVHVDLISCNFTKYDY